MGRVDSALGAPSQLQFGFPEPCVVMRARPDGRIEARWPALELCMTFESWAWALARVPAVTAALGAPLELRVRR